MTNKEPIQIPMTPEQLKTIYNLVSFASYLRSPDDEPLTEECIELLATYLSEVE